MPELLTKFLRQYPHIQIRQILATTEHIQQVLELGQVDFWISYPPIASIENQIFQMLPILTGDVWLAVPPQHSLRDIKKQILLTILNQ